MLDAFIGLRGSSDCVGGVFGSLVDVVVGVTARLEDVVESDQVAFDVDVRMIDGVADAGLRREVYDDVGLVGVKNLIHKAFVGDAASDKNMPDRGFDRVDQAEAVLLELRIIVIVHIVEADHGSARELAAEAHDDVRADKAGRTGDKDGFVVEGDRCFAHCIVPSGVSCEPGV